MKNKSDRISLIYIEGQGYLMSADIKTLLEGCTPKTPPHFFLKKSKQKNFTRGKYNG